MDDKNYIDSIDITTKSIDEFKQKQYNITKKLIQNEIKRIRSSQYYHANREEILELRKERIMCSCGKMVNKATIKRHQKSNYHKENWKFDGLRVLTVSIDLNTATNNKNCWEPVR
tara:strand:+ start:1282 stop:1626 length:345 start_codon:yes stop_codon:yes gene_type:complete